MEMMTGRTLFRNYKEYDLKEVEICGWVKSNRGSKKFGFLVINDGTFFETIQVVYDQEMGNFDTVSKLNVGTAVIVNGTVIVTPDAKQPFEIHAKSVEVEGECPSDYPLQKKRHTLEYLRSISHLRPRTNTFSFVSKTPAVTLPAAPIPVKYASLIFSFWATSFNFAQISSPLSILITYLLLNFLYSMIIDSFLIL